MRACGAHDSQWRDGRQHDAQEYLRSILEAMQVDHTGTSSCSSAYAMGFTYTVNEV